MCLPPSLGSLQLCRYEGEVQLDEMGGKDQKKNLLRRKVGSVSPPCRPEIPRYSFWWKEAFRIPSGTEIPWKSNG